MDIKQALSVIIADSGMKKYGVAKSLGRSPNYVYQLLAKPTYPSYGVITKIADVCGWDLALVKRDGDSIIRLDKPEE